MKNVKHLKKQEQRFGTKFSVYVNKRCHRSFVNVPLLMVYNLTPWYHGCSNSATVDHSTSMETSQRHFMIVPGAFLEKVLDQETRPTWERKSARVDRMWLFCVG